MSLHSDIAAEIAALRAQVAEEEATYKKHADLYEETGSTLHAAKAEYALGRAAGLLTGINALGRVRGSLHVALGRWG